MAKSANKAKPSAKKSEGGNLPQVQIKSRDDLRAWLFRHHTQAGGIWLVIAKKVAGRTHVSYDAIVEEALCFGWIDSTPRKADATRSKVLLSPRKTGSGWSKKNKRRIAKLTKAGLMAPHGVAKVEAAKLDGAWDKLNTVDKLSAPRDLSVALHETPQAAAFFKKFPPSARRAILEWIENAKQPATRQRRIAATARLAGQNIRANQHRQPKSR
ncbi:MAG: YdeI/OmpD-associated family protein [Hyphomicrobium sp.]